MSKAKFIEGDTVAIREDRPQLGLTSGDTGRVWALYALDPPEYEVTFCGADGREFDVTVTEDEIVAAPARQRVATG